MLFDENGNVVSQSALPVQLNRLSDTQVEQNPEELLQSVEQVIRQVLDANKDKNITACGLATQRSTVLAWNLLNNKTSNIAASTVLVNPFVRANHDHLHPGYLDRC